MYIINGTSALASEDFNKLLPVKGLVGDALGNYLNDPQGEGTLFFSGFHSAKIFKASEGKLMFPSGHRLNSVEGTIVWTLPVSRLNFREQSLIPFELNVLEVENNKLQKLVNELELKVYTLQMENFLLKSNLQEVFGNSVLNETASCLDISIPISSIRKGDEIMETIRKIFPLNQIAVLILSFWLISFSFSNISSFNTTGVATFHPMILLALFIMGIGWGGTSLVCLFQIWKALRN